MKHLKKFDSVSDMESAIETAAVDFIGLAYDTQGGTAKVRIVKEVPPPDPKTIPFYIDNISDSENTVTITRKTYAPILTIEKSLDNKTWETMGTTSSTPITATIPPKGRLYLRCYTDTWCGRASNKILCNNHYNIGGNIMSLLFGSYFTGKQIIIRKTNAFSNLFEYQNKLVDASNLLLPATTLKSSCYSNMFKGCTSLTTAPALPATTLVDNCYNSMFRDCTSLTTAPELPATTLTDWCYCYMFSGCTNLNYIKCLATDISASQCTGNWVQGVASTGTFVKNPSMSKWGTVGVMYSDVPSGWTIQDAPK